VRVPFEALKVGFFNFFFKKKCSYGKTDKGLLLKKLYQEFVQNIHKFAYSKSASAALEALYLALQSFRS